VQEQETRFEREMERRTGRRADGLSLLRKPVVQLVLVVTAVAQVATVLATAAGEDPGTSLTAIELPAAVVSPMTDPALRSAWLERAIERESERLGSEYRQRGYNVTPTLASQIGRAAAEFDIKPEVAFGLIRAESGFRNSATSPVGAVGLTQLMPRTAAWMQPGVTRAQLRDPETNLRIGFKYMRYLLDKYEGDERLALLAYNRGPGTVDRALRTGRNPDNGYADFVYGKKNHGHRLFTNR
jgi:soluble lytic murein transglycosylase-like protein